MPLCCAVISSYSVKSTYNAHADCCSHPYLKSQQYYVPLRWPKERKLLLASIDNDVSKDNSAISSARDEFFISINLGYRRPKTVLSGNEPYYKASWFSSNQC
jgi:hypothetical protein